LIRFERIFNIAGILVLGKKIRHFPLEATSEYERYAFGFVMPGAKLNPGLEPGIPGRCPREISEGGLQRLCRIYRPTGL
jgi:hypothetical protein